MSTESFGSDAQWKNNDGDGVNLVETQDPSHTDDREEFQTLEAVCELGWEAHRAWERIIGEAPLPHWDDLSNNQQQTVRDLVVWIYNHPTSHMGAQHDAWRSYMASHGWQHGTKKDSSARRHPNLVPFDDLPYSQNRKACLWRHIVMCMYDAT